MVRKRTLAINLAIGLLVGMQATLAEAQQQVPSDNRYIIGSNAPGSVPYNIGIGLSSLAQIVLLPEKNLALAPVATDGYDSSLQQVLNGAGHFAIIDSVAAHQALAAADDRFEVVATLWHEVDYFILASEYVRTGTISDLATLWPPISAMRTPQAGFWLILACLSTNMPDRPRSIGKPGATISTAVRSPASR